VGEDGRWLRYHHLFGEFLQAQFEKERPDQLEPLLRRIAHVYTTRGEWIQAYALYERMGDASATTQLIGKAGTDLIRTAQYAVLAKWLDALPPDVLDSHPSLISHKGTILLIQGQVEKSLEYLNKAEASQRQSQDHSELARTLDRRAAAYRYLGNYQASIQDGMEVLELSGENEELLSARAGALRSIGVSLYHQGQLEKAYDMLYQSLMLFRSLKDEQNCAQIHIELGICCQYLGDVQQAVNHNEQSLQYWQGVRNTTRQSVVLNNLGSLYHIKGNYIEAAKHFEHALTLARSNGFLRSEAYLLFNLGNIYSDLEANDSAREAFQKTRDACQKLDDHFLLLNVDLAESALARREGKFSRSHAYLASARQLADKSHSSFEDSLWALEAGRLALAENKLDRALVQLTNSLKLFDEGGQKLEAATAALLLCHVNTLRGDQPMSKSILARALGLTGDLDSIQPLLVVGRGTKEELKSFATDAQIGPPAIKLLSRIENFERQIPSLRRKLRPHAATVLLIPPKLGIYALGKSQVRLDGEPVTAHSWANQKRARELFFYLVSHPDKNLTKEEIGVALWPESSSEQLRLQFRNTVYYIRYALGQEVITSNERRYGFNSDMDYSYDVQEFERRVSLADGVETPTKKIDLLQEALKIYQGEFFPEGEGTWVMAERQRLSQIYEHSLLELTRLLLENGEPKLALSYSQKILAENHCMESAHCLAMQAFAALGDRSGIANQFEQCKQYLQDELGLEPSQETIKIYKLLR
jgi:LuxR family maltose regulon positive regulatory protein